MVSFTANEQPITGENFKVIQKVFSTELIQSDANKSFVVSAVSIEGKINKYKLILKANQGFVFADGSITLESKEFLVNVKLLITSQKDPKISGEEMRAFTGEPSELVTEAKFEIIKKAFFFSASLT
jgi:hypothetical protein